MRIVAENRHEERMVETVIAKSGLKTALTLKDGVLVVHGSKIGYDVFEKMLCLIIVSKRGKG